MCGFAGFLAHGGAARERVALVHAMGKQIAHRGPDDCRAYDDGALTIVFRRLAIVDVAGGAQPLANEDETLWLVANAEIFNHRDLRRRLRERHAFRTQTDVEVLLHLYEERGPDMLVDVLGMFAFAIWDRPKRTLLLARDRLGIKPLYYYHAAQKDLLLFGSELKALLRHPACPVDFDWQDLYIKPESRLPTFVKGVEQLPGGCYAICRTDDVPTTHRYWSLEDHFSSDGSSNARDDCCDTYRALFDDAIKTQLMSDVPQGVFLSGGVDSAVIVAAAARYLDELPCFTVAEPTTIASGDVSAAETVARISRAVHYPVAFDEADFIERTGLSLGGFEYFVWLLDRPEFRPDYVFKHELHRFARTHFLDLKVILSGQGADEFAGGYSNQLHRTRAGWTDYLERDVIPREMMNECSSAGVPPQMFEYMRRPTAADRPDAYRSEMRYYAWMLQAVSLWYEDRVGAAHGIEVRVPFLDHRLVEFLAGIPTDRHADLFWDKRVIRQMAHAWLPPLLCSRRKVGFYHGERECSVWRVMRRAVHSLFEDFVDAYMHNAERRFSERKIRALLGQVDNQSDWQQRLRLLIQCMAIITFEAVCRRIHTGWLPEPLTSPSALSRYDVGAVFDVAAKGPSG